MTRFFVSETQTPDDHLLERARVSNSFSTDSTDPLEIAEVAMTSLRRDKLFDEFKEEIALSLNDQKWIDDFDDNSFTFGFRTNSAEFVYEVNQEPDGTPITDEAIIKWAEKKVAENPVYNDKDPENPGQTIKKPNTVEHELALAAHGYVTTCLADYKANDLRQYVAELLWDGVKGYRDMSREELLKEINELIVPTYAEVGIGTMEDLPFFSE